MSENAITPQTIWAGDLFDRRTEAEQLIGYIESLAGRPVREDRKAFTIAVDAQYGEGKSFFVRRLADHLGLDHPVAFVDAWSDDLADEPLTALAATLKKALEPFVTQPEVASRLKTFMAKTGKVAKIASVGALKRAASLALTAGAVEGMSEVVDGASEAVKGAVADVGKGTVDGTIDDISEAVKSVTAHELMEQRVVEFEEGQAAVREMKESLAAIVSALGKSGKRPPIVIVIDELDRCRPTYAIKLLEEIKHLFDVAGVVFVLAMHTGQLSHSVSGAYGSKFDGKAYLRRFIDRQYRLKEPRLEPLVEKLCMERTLELSRLRFPPVVSVQDRKPITSSPPQLIAEYMRMYGLSARDAHQVIDVLETSLALTGTNNLHGVYLLPLIFGHLQGAERGSRPQLRNPSDIGFRRGGTAMQNNFTIVDTEAAYDEFVSATAMSNKKLVDRLNSGHENFAVQIILNDRHSSSRPFPLWDLTQYPELIATVSRFSNPASTT